jgi:hypothetical protein
MQLRQEWHEAAAAALPPVPVPVAPAVEAALVALCAAPLDFSSLQVQRLSYWWLLFVPW